MRLYAPAVADARSNCKQHYAWIGDRGNPYALACLGMLPPKFFNKEITLPSGETIIVTTYDDYYTFFT